MLLFRSEEGVRQWCAARDREPGAILTLEEAWRAAIARFGPVLDPAYRGLDLPDLTARFHAQGFTGPFWDATRP